MPAHTPSKHRGIEELFRPQSIVFVGASSDPDKPAGRPLQNVIEQGFKGKIWAVNPKYDKIGSVPCFADIADLPEVPDVAMILVGAAKVEGYVRQLSDMGTPVSLVFAGGYAETGDTGTKRQDNLLKAAGKMRILGPNSIGLISLTNDVCLTASAAMNTNSMRTGSIAILSQSGGILGSLMSRAADRGIGFSHLVATGNECDIEVSDLIDFLLDEPSTAVLCLYLETLRNPQRFRKVAEKALSMQKPLIVYKVGKSEAGVSSVASHTGALAGEDRLFDALFKQVGAIRVKNYTDLIDLPMAFVNDRKLDGNRIAILTSTGGAGGLVADICGSAGFSAPEPDALTVSSLNDVMKDEGFNPSKNPIDVTMAGVKPEILSKSLSCLLKSDNYDVVIPIAGSSSIKRPGLVADPVIEQADSTSKPIIVYVSPSAPEVLKRLNQNNVPAYDRPEACAVALKSLQYMTELWSRSTEVLEAEMAYPETNDKHELAKNGLPDLEGLSELKEHLNEAESKSIFRAFSIPTVQEIAVKSPESAQQSAQDFQFPIVVKLLTREHLHKTELDGVRLGVKKNDVTKVCYEISEALQRHKGTRPDGFLLQEQVENGIEMILGYVHAPLFGHGVLLGNGGVMAELYKDHAIRMLPIDRYHVESMLDELTISKLLNGYRGRPAADRHALIDTVLKFADMIETMDGKLLEAEINPLFVLEKGEGVLAGDGVMVLSG